MILICKYAWVIPLKDGTITKTFQKILYESFRKTSKIWVDKGSDFHKRLIKSWLQDKDIKAYSTHNEWKSVVAECFIRTVKFTDK